MEQKKYFISHDTHSVREAVALKSLLEDLNNNHKICLTSDWNSIDSDNI